MCVYSLLCVCVRAIVLLHSTPDGHFLVADLILKGEKIDCVHLAYSVVTYDIHGLYLIYTGW